MSSLMKAFTFTVPDKQYLVTHSWKNREKNSCGAQEIMCSMFPVFFFLLLLDKWKEEDWVASISNKL